MQKVEGFLQFSDRLASLRLKTRGGRFSIVSAYAPHNLRSYDERHGFYLDLGRLLDTCSVNGPKCILGDFNAKIGQRRAGEDDVFGLHCFGREAVHRVESPNRDLLLEFCTDRSLIVANTFENTLDEHKVTYFEPGHAPMGRINTSTYHMLDLVLVPQEHSLEVDGTQSIREASLATNHYLVVKSFRLDLERNRHRQLQVAKDRSALERPEYRQRFCSAFKATTMNTSASASILEDKWHDITAGFNAAEKVLPNLPPKANKPWISERTLDLIRQRAQARTDNDYVAEKIHSQGSTSCSTSRQDSMVRK